MNTRQAPVESVRSTTRYPHVIRDAMINGAPVEPKPAIGKLGIVVA
jgi:hypothetical protein